MALAELQQEPIADENEDSSNAVTLRTFFDTALDTALKAHPWDFAIKYTQLTLVSEEDNVTPYQFLFQLPADFLEYVRVYDSQGTSVVYEAGANNALYTNTNPAYLKYIYRNTDFGSYDSSFAECLAVTLAEKCASKIVGTQGREQYLEGKAGRVQAIAASKSVGRGKSTYLIDSTWANTKQAFS